MLINRVKSNISIYLPALIEIVGNSSLDWDYIDSLFLNKIENRIINQEISVEATIYDIIIEVKKQNKKAIQLLDFLNKLFSDILINLNEQERKLIRDNIRNLLTALDKKYLNFVGEIGVLNNIMNTRMYELEAVEVKLPNEKKIDFKLRELANNMTILVEVDNIHLNSEKVEADEEKIKKFISDRTTKKIAKKKMNLQNNIDFYVVPVLWGTWKDLKTYSEYFKKNTIQIQNVIEPVAYLTFVDPNDEDFCLHRFNKISNLFNNI